MMNHTQLKKILMVGDCFEENYQYSFGLRSEYTYTFSSAETSQPALLQCQQADCLLLDNAILGHDLTEYLPNLTKKNDLITCPVIVLIDSDQESVALQALKSGSVQDYLLKENLTKPNIFRAIYYAIEKVELQRQLAEKAVQLDKAKQEREQVLAVKNQFLAMINHELRTPLNSILGLSEVLEDQVYGSLNQKQQKCIHTIRNSGNHLLQLITELIELSQISTNHLKLKKTLVSVSQICQTSLSLVQQNLKDKRLKMSSSYDYAVSTVLVDKQRLIEILSHLLDNAVKFTPEGGTIGLEVTGDSAQNRVNFIVWDTGIGMDKNKSEQLFQPFFQQESHMTRKQEGLGLGLSLAYHLTKMHDGDISVDSEPGKGCRVTVSLPWQTDEKPLFMIEESSIVDMSQKNAYLSKNRSSNQRINQ
jgi:signal transduction histidine kinase